MSSIDNESDDIDVLSKSSSNDEKTIPFLRRLWGMLQENDDMISFLPGKSTGNNPVLGRIVVHDRIKVEAQVLPRYFNHSSFASLRRQLNYFSFVRLGKGRQRESTYINADVVELDDILRLKRRAAGVADDKESIEMLKVHLQSHLEPSKNRSRPKRKKIARVKDSSKRKASKRGYPQTDSRMPSQCVSEDDEQARAIDVREIPVSVTKYDSELWDAAAAVLSLRSTS